MRRGHCDKAERVSLRVRVGMLFLIGLSVWAGVARGADDAPVAPGAEGDSYAVFSGAGVGTPKKLAPVKAELIADTTAVTPGRPFRLGVRLTLEPGWHVYWRTAGDVGRPTEIKWMLPEGFKAGKLEWPLPERFEAGGLISYGYEKQVLLFTTVTPPAQGAVGAGAFRFEANVSWIACQESCIPGDAKAALTLPGGSGEVSAAAKEFDAAAAQVPVELNVPQTERVQLQFEPAPVAPTPGKEQRLSVTANLMRPWQIDMAGAPPALYPVARGDWSTSHPFVQVRGVERVRFAWPVTWAKDGNSTGSELEAVLRLPLVNAEKGERRVERVSVVYPTAGKQAGSAKAEEQAGIPPKGGTPEHSKQVFSFYQGAARVLPLWMIFLYAFLGGVILNVMPCVLPVLSLKVLAFVRQSGEERGRTFRLGVAYTLGVLASFGVLAGVVVALQAAGTQVGQGFQLQEPRFVAAMTGIVFAVSLSLLGVYTIELPGAAVNQLDRIGRREGYPGAFFSGVLSTALATPCTAPFLGPALAFSFTQPPALVVAIFLVWGLGLAAPYLILAANPGLLRFVPKPGRWMLVFEQFMGFVMLGFAVWLLEVLGTQAGAPAVVGTVAFLLAVGVACWLVGLAGRAGVSRGRWALTLGAALTLAVGGFIGFPARYLRDYQAGTGAGSRTTALTEGKIPWQPFSVERVEQYVKEGRTVFVDFTADWCQTCKFNEWRTLETERVRELFKQYDVVPIKADWTARDETIGRVLNQFGSAGVPLYVIFPAGEAGKPRVLPPGLISVEAIERTLREKTPGS